MTLHAPQVIVICLCILEVIVHICKHGESRQPWNGPISFIDQAVWVGLLYWGGFFG
jgi:hypothetical protein